MLPFKSNQKFYHLELAILSAKPIDELVDLGSLDNTGEIVEKILYGNIEEKLDALVLFNEIVTSNIFV